MKTLNLALVVVVGIGLTGCSGESPAAPATAGTASAAEASRTASSPGMYTLTFVARVGGTLQEVTSLRVSSTELVLKAYVTDSAGRPAQDGAVTFEYCSYRGGPANDITRADEAPLEACDQLGTGTWERLTTLSVYPGHCPPLGAGYACMNFGLVRIPRDVGFRFKFSAQRSGIASGTSQAKNFTWTSGS